MRVGRSGKRNAVLHCEFNNGVAWVRFVYRLTPARSGKLNGEVLCTNEIKRFIDQGAYLCARPMTMDFNEIQMGETIDQPGRCYFPDTTKITGVNCVDVLALELLGTIRHAVEHLIGAIEKMH